MAAKLQNVFNFIDYKAPIINEINDFRTSTYMGLRKFQIPEQNIKRSYPDVCHTFQRGNTHHLTNETETHSQYILKNVNTSNNFIRPDQSNYVDYMKGFVETKLNHVPRPISVTKSTTNRCYSDINQFLEPCSILSTTPLIYPKSLQKYDNMFFDSKNLGYLKYLDLMATTNSLTYVQHSKEERNSDISASDHITFWNWPKMVLPSDILNFSPSLNTEIMCNMNSVARECQQIKKFPKKMKLVPNNGMITEVQTNYKVPPEGKNEIRLRNKYATEKASKCDLFKVPPDDKRNPLKTENSMYGSGDRIQKYLNVYSVNNKI